MIWVLIGLASALVLYIVAWYRHSTLTTPWPLFTAGVAIPQTISQSKHKTYCLRLSGQRQTRRGALLLLGLVARSKRKYFANDRR